MAYDRFDRDRDRDWRDEDERRAFGWGRDRDDPRFERGDYDRGHEDRGFFERMGDEFRSWFGDEDRNRDLGRGRDEDRWRPTYGERDYNPRWEDELERGAPHGRREDRDFGRGDVWDRDPYRRTSFAGSRVNSSHDDVHYGEWRRRQMHDLDRDYDDYRRERQTHFEKDFGDWRDRRQSKRQLLDGLREHMEVVGSDGKHVGTVDRVAGDRVILTRSDPDSGGVHHSLSCTDIDRVEGERVILDCSADKARERWRDESRGRALFEREDQGRAGPHVLDRSFSGTYR
ncbi:MAG TPA: DUF2171 domain-containing protein [Sphingomicrobium sp.]|nr:DUF2171 domain-containing protein [Sphingomicrobium sp.]